MTTASPWVRDAVRFPLAFAQVREDPLLDRRVVELCGGRARVLMVASGGCTAAALAAWGGVSELHLVDPNPSQMALARLKLDLLGEAPADRRRLMGHEALPSQARRHALEMRLLSASLPLDIIGPPDDVARLGPDHAGRYERLFAAFREALADSREALEELLRQDDPEEQSRRVEPGTTLGSALDAAFDDAFALPNLVALFGQEATRNPLEPFARHFAGRLRWVLGRQATDRNPFLWQLLLGRFAPGAAHAWLTAPSPAAMPALRWTVGTMDEALERHSGAFDFVHLSNILDWLSPDAAARTLRLASNTLATGGWVFVRQLNSSLDIPSLGPAFRWEAEPSEQLLQEDRSFFYRSLHLGRKP